jgi:hypothetical protein
MRLRAVTALSMLAWAAACSMAGPDRPLQMALGERFSLKVGQSAQTRDGAWRVGFEGVGADSRCPKGEQCVWAGDATVRVWLQSGSGPRAARELHTAPALAQATRVPGHELRLVLLEPYPVAARLPVMADYVATLTFSQAAAPVADR